MPVAGDASGHWFRVHPHWSRTLIMVNLNWNLSWTESENKLLTAGKPCYNVVDLKHGSYKVVLMLPPPLRV